MKKQKRDMQAMEKTKQYFLSRDGRPTSVKKAAKDLKVPPSRLQSRLSVLVKENVLVRTAHGVYMSRIADETPSELTLEDLLIHLKKDREELDAKIVRLQEAIAIRDGFVAAGKAKP